MSKHDAVVAEAAAKAHVVVTLSALPGTTARLLSNTKKRERIAWAKFRGLVTAGISAESSKSGQGRALATEAAGERL